METVTSGKVPGVNQGLLEIVAMFDQFRTKFTHRPVFLDRVAEGNDDGCRDAGETGRQGDALAVIAPGCSDDSRNIGLACLELLHVDEPTTDLESADPGVVFMLDPDFSAAAPAEQRPVVKGGLADVTAHNPLGRLQGLERGHGLFSTMMASRAMVRRSTSSAVL